MINCQEVQKAHAKATVAIIDAFPDISIDSAAKIVDTIAYLVMETLRSSLDEEKE
jgi:alanine racemase